MKYSIITRELLNYFNMIDIDLSLLLFSTYGCWPHKPIGFYRFWSKSSCKLVLYCLVWINLYLVLNRWWNVTLEKSECTVVQCDLFSVTSISLRWQVSVCLVHWHHISWCRLLHFLSSCYTLLSGLAYQLQVESTHEQNFPFSINTIL